MNKKDLERAIDSVLGARGFVKRRSTWYRKKPDVVQLLDLQKSEFGGQYYINVAIAVRQLLSDDFPREEKCCLRVRVEHLLGDKDTVSKLLDLENPAMDAERVSQITTLASNAAEFLDDMEDLDAIRNEVRSNTVLRTRSTLALRHLLGIED